MPAPMACAIVRAFFRRCLQSLAVMQGDAPGRQLKPGARSALAGEGLT